MYLSLNLPTLETDKITWHEDKIIDKSHNPAINKNRKLGYWSHPVDDITYDKLQELFSVEIMSNSQVLVQFIRSSANDHPHKDSYPWTFMYIIDDADGYTNLYDDNKKVISSHVTQKEKWALLKTWNWHSPAGILENKIRKAIVIRLKKDFDLQFLLEGIHVA